MLLYPIVATQVFRTTTSRKLLEAATVEEGAKGYVRGYLILLAESVTSALFGHALVYLGAGTLPAGIGTAVSFILMWLVAPRRGNLTSADTHFVAMGQRSLTAELTRPWGPIAL